MPGSHAKLSPSSAKRWMTCPGSVKLIEEVEAELGPEEDTTYAALGTSLHEAGEYCIRHKVEPEDTIGMEFYGHEVTEDDIHRFDQYVYYVRDLPGRTYLEQLVTVIKDLVWGTSDTVNLQEMKLIIADLKTGYIQVDAEENEQLLCYALGAYMSYGMIEEITEVEMVISQPTTSHFSTWTVGINRLNEFYIEVVAAIERIKTHPDELNPSEEACRWCRARGTCPALKKVAQEEARKDFQAMSNMELAEANALVPLLEHYISGVKARTHETLKSPGGVVPGFKMVEGRRSRAWIDEDATQKYLSRKIPKFNQNAFTHKFKSPNQIEIVIKSTGDSMFRPAKKLKEFIEVRAGKPTVVPESDKRNALEYGQSAAADFADVTEPEGSQS